MQLVRIKILSWNKHNLDKRIKKLGWIKLSVDFDNDDKLFKLSICDKYVFVKLLCYAAVYSENTGEFSADVDKISHVFNIDSRTLMDSFEKLNKNNVIYIENGVQHVITCKNTLDTGQIRLEEIRLDKNIYSAPNGTQHSFDLQKFIEEKVYVEYPRKLGKSRGTKTLLAGLKAKVKHLPPSGSAPPQPCADLLTAVKNYKAFCLSEKLESKFIKHFSTWAGEWQDWVNPETIKKQPTKTFIPVEEIIHE